MAIRVRLCDSQLNPNRTHNCQKVLNCTSPIEQNNCCHRQRQAILCYQRVPWSHGQAWFVIYDIPRRVWRPIRARTHLATPQMKEWLRRSSNSTRKGQSHHHNTDKRPFVERKSRWMSAQIFWLADWLVRDMWPDVVSRPPQWVRAPCWFTCGSEGIS